MVVVIHLPEHGRGDRLFIAWPIVGPVAGGKPVDGAEMPLAIRVVVAIEAGEADDGGKGAEPIGIGEGMEADGRVRDRPAAGVLPCRIVQAADRLKLLGVYITLPPAGMGPMATACGSAVPARNGMGRESENLAPGAGEPPSAAGAVRRVPRLADYTGGLIAIRERKGGALGVSFGQR